MSGFLFVISGRIAACHFMLKILLRSVFGLSRSPSMVVSSSLRDGLILADKSKMERRDEADATLNNKLEGLRKTLPLISHS